MPLYAPRSKYAARQVRSTGPSNAASGPPERSSISLVAAMSGVRALSFERYRATIQAMITVWRFPPRSWLVGRVHLFTAIAALSFQGFAPGEKLKRLNPTPA